MIKMELLKDFEEHVEGDIVEVSEEFAPELKEKEIAIEYVESTEDKSEEEKTEKKEKKQTKEVETKQVETDEDIDKIVDEVVSKKLKAMETEKKESKKGLYKMENIEVKDMKKSPEVKLHEAFVASKALATNKWSEEAKAIVGQGETTDADGGYLVDNEIVQDIYRVAMDTAVVAPKVAQRPVGLGNNVLQLRQLNQSNATPADYQGVALSVVAEGAAITPDKVAFKTATASVNKLAALFATTSEIEEDVPGMANYISGLVGEAFGLVLDDEILHGTSSLLTALVGDTSTAKQLVTPGAPTDAQLRALYMNNINPATAEWYMSGDAYQEVMGVEDGNGNALVQANYQVAPYGTLFGRPINIVPCMKATSAAGAILFANMGNAYTLGTKGGVKFASSIHLYFNTDQSAWRWVLRAAGLPSKATALTLADGRTVAPCAQSTEA